VLTDTQAFARKLISSRPGVTLENIQNEIRAASKLCTPPTHKNIVGMLKHGRFSAAFGRYFLDMELCDLNLEDHLGQLGPTEKILPHLDHLPSWMRMQAVWRIIEDISGGVIYIHSNGEIHRDLKPQNSTYSFPMKLIFSTLFSS
jgi:serine/threonine protein kinase